MTTPGKPSDDARLLAAFADVIRDGAEPRSPAELEHGLRRLVGRIAIHRTRRWAWARWTLVGATAALLVAVGLRLGSQARAPRAPTPLVLRYTIEGGSVLEGGYLREAGHAGIKLFFNEGSKLVFAPGTRGRLRAVDHDGARVAIEQGTASFQVTPSNERRWLVEVGPFVVAVKGTIFTVAWDPSSELFELKLRHGRVVVSGPMSGGDIVLRAGQRLVVSLSSAETLIMEDQPDTAVGGPAVAPAAAPDEPSPARSTSRPRVVREPAAPAAAASAPANPPGHWVDQLANGHWDRILAEVERTGTRAALDRASSEDLLALADAARYRRRTDLARAALLAELRRFPGSSSALDALFLLGRVEEAHERGVSQAINWYDAYLTRAPAGPYAAEALGRKMILTNEVGGAADARPLAEEYLRRFPKGSYAGSARALARAQ
jgi:TolA-binding protein